MAFAAATSIATIGLYISYGLPILIGMLNPSGFIHGPFDLKWASRPIALIAVGWIIFITIIFCLPQLYPVNSQTLNYTPVCVGIILFWCIASWFLWARKWFVGPIRQIEEEMAGTSELEGREKEIAGSEGSDGPNLNLEKGDKGSSLLKDMKAQGKEI